MDTALMKISNWRTKKLTTEIVMTLVQYSSVKLTLTVGSAHRQMIWAEDSVKF